MFRVRVERCGTFLLMPKGIRLGLLMPKGTCLFVPMSAGTRLFVLMPTMARHLYVGKGRVTSVKKSRTSSPQAPAPCAPREYTTV